MNETTLLKFNTIYLDYKQGLIVSILFSLSFVSSPIQAQFTFNFTPTQHSPDEIANEIGALCGRFGNLHCDVETRGDFLPEGRSVHATDWAHEIYTADDGKKYWHIIIGDPSDGFILEYYAAMGSVNPDFARDNEAFLSR